ncbi:MAG: hypothetical protein Q7K40_00135 [bacterium]|nr:hypothetical protein [bacterium]
MEKSNIGDNIFYVIMFMLALLFLFNITFSVFNILMNKLYFGFNKVSPEIAYYAISSIFLFNVVFLRKIKNAQFWRTFFYAGVFILILKNIMTVYSYTISHELGAVYALLFGNLIFGLFLYANYQYSFKLDDQSKNKDK